jgi:hypothetical protein
MQIGKPLRTIVVEPVITENLVRTRSPSAGAADRGNVETANQGVLNRKSGSAKRSRRREEIWSWLANSLRWFARPGQDNRKP